MVVLLLLSTITWLADLVGCYLCKTRIMINATSKAMFAIEETIIPNIKSIKMHPMFKLILIFGHAWPHPTKKTD